MRIPCNPPVVRNAPDPRGSGAGLHGFSGADRGGGILHLGSSVAHAPPRPLNGITLARMSALISKPYIERLFAEKNLAEIYWAISVVGKDRELPEEFWLFSRIYEWGPARSGVWQYYDGL